MEISSQPLEVQKKIEEIRKGYQSLIGEQTSLSALVMGTPGVGKSTFACSGRLPILIDIFDPKGTVFIHTNPVLSKMYDEGKIIIRPFWNEDSSNPTEYERWETLWRDDLKTGFLKMFGTYVIDSGTSFLEAMSNYVRKKKGRPENLAIQDYIPLYNTLMDIIKLSSAQSCDFIYTAHLLLVQDEVTGEIKAVMDTYKGLRSKVPKLFTEKYILVKKASSSGAKHVLLTHSAGRFEASSQLASSGKIPAEIEPNLKELLKLAGLPTEDKPIPWTTQEEGQDAIK